MFPENLKVRRFCRFGEVGKEQAGVRWALVVRPVAVSELVSDRMAIIDFAESVRIERFQTVSEVCGAHKAVGGFQSAPRCSYAVERCQHGIAKSGRLAGVMTDRNLQFAEGREQAAH